MSRLATIGILSIGDMGVGIAKLLASQGYRVVTNLEGRGQATHTRAQQASIEALPTDSALVQESDYIFSIVPPRDAFATAKRITTAFKTASQVPERTAPLYYLDLNAISPRSAREIAALFEKETPDQVRLIDGGIIGSPPSLKAASAPATETKTTETSSTPDPADITSWQRPSIPLSGPHPLPSTHLLSTLNARHLTPLIGSASGLKSCFASTTKGLTALCIQAFTTAHNLGVLDELKREMATFNPAILRFGERGVTGMPPKAYRWEAEMREIGTCHADDGGFVGGGNGLFDAVAEIYRSVAQDTILGLEVTENRKRGRTTEDVATAISEGLREKKKKSE